MSEEILWKGSPSQILHLGRHLLALVVVGGLGWGGMLFPPVWFALPLPLLWMLWNYLVVRCRTYELTTERLRLYEGVLNQTIDEVELYRVKDTTMDRPFWFRMFGLSNLHLDTSDRSHPKVTIEAVSDGIGLRETLRKQVEFWRDRKRVREVDFEEGGELEGDDSLI
ncbi:putative membrane protein YdbT with pleckstrin-like domain [Haloferula luteola]|uniref:Putative membrane protein YdbT with pleckstrin-like domain n=1 Tax=Haloferula luteola TaxID=595692 RepID=A0A840V573_9BACT|nr:PH domain-containing protein [Haloferula luteola]MBB5350784.1 putative membrane protein YdbT with pleckstrin-like domain [Haloferula luteola]